MPIDPDTPPEPRQDKAAASERKPLPDSKVPSEKKNKQAADKEETPDVRVAGRKEMDLPPEDWDEIDEEADESFPASDPPGNY